MKIKIENDELTKALWTKTDLATTNYSTATIKVNLRPIEIERITFKRYINTKEINWWKNKNKIRIWSSIIRSWLKIKSNFRII